VLGQLLEALVLSVIIIIIAQASDQQRTNL
jgi:hypothetical protein